MKRLAALLLAAVPAACLACGVCIEDKVAATYDHAIVTRALAQHRPVVFAAIDARQAAPRAVAAVRTAATRVSGVELVTVRTSTDPLAVSFVVNGTDRTPEQVLADLGRNASGVKLTMIRVLR